MKKVRILLFTILLMFYVHHRTDACFGGSGISTGFGEEEQEATTEQGTTEQGTTKQDTTKQDTTEQGGTTEQATTEDTKGSQEKDGSQEKKGSKEKEGSKEKKGSKEKEDSGESTAKVNPAYAKVAKMLLQSMDIHDLAKTRVSTLAKLPKEAIMSIDDLKDRMPPGVYENNAALSEREMAQGIAELLNNMPAKSIQKIGPNWLDIVPLLPEETWHRLDEKVVENIPWRGLVANMEPSVWGQMSFVAFNRFPDRFYKNVPMKVWKQVPPSTLVRIKPSKLNLIRTAFMRQMKWGKMAAAMPDAKLLNGMPKDKLVLLPWKRITPNLRPSVLGRLDGKILTELPPKAFEDMTVRQFRSLSPSVLSQLKVSQLQKVKISVYKSLPNGQLRAIGEQKLRVVTNGEISLDDDATATTSA